MTAHEVDGHSRVEHPVLWLGISGFAPAQRGALEAWLTRPGALPLWRVCAFGDADAWWVNGAKVRVLPNGNLMVAPGLPTEHTLTLNLGDVDRPVAFAMPMATDFEPRCAFDPGSSASVHAALLQFDTWLRPLRSQFVLGKQLIERKMELGRNVYHVIHRGSLLAVLDLHDRKVALAPGMHPLDLWDARWYKRPVGARDTPPNFVSCTPGELAWAYVRRTERDMLPPHYRASTIFYRRVPQVPVRWLHDSHLMLLRELAAEPAGIQSLVRRTGLPLAVLELDLACLYYAGAVTTTPAKAALLRRRRDAGLHVGEPASNSPTRQDCAHHDLTAPASLEHKDLAHADPRATR